MPTPDISAPEDRILMAVGRYHYLRIDQIMRLLGYKAGTKRTIEKRLAKLVAGGYLVAKAGYTQRAGLPPTIYKLGEAGRNEVEKRLPLRPRARKGEWPRRDFLEHLLGLNDLLIAAARLVEESDGAIWEAEMQHEQIMLQDPFIVTLPDGTKGGLVPDAWLDLRFPRIGQRPLRDAIWFEFDRGTERQDATRSKIAKLLALSIDPTSYEARFGTNNLTVAFVTVPERSPELRRDQLCSWIRLEEQRIGGIDRDDLFFVTCLDPATVSPQHLFLDPVWFLPSRSEPLPLIELPEGGL